MVARIPLKSLRKLRRYVSPEREYVIRRILYSALPVAHQAAPKRVVHCGTWKTASQWARNIFSDPRVYRASGLKPYYYGERSEILSGKTAPETGILTPAYLSFDEAAGLFQRDTDRFVFVARDPRDLVVSHYYSLLSSHPERPSVSRWRKELAQLDKKEGIKRIIDEFDTFASILRSWSDKGGNYRVLITRYEDLTGTDTLAAWRRVFHHGDIALPDQTIQRLLNTYSFSRITGGRQRGAEDQGHKYRKGVSGDWQNHFDDDLLAYFFERYGDLLELYGYR